MRILTGRSLGFVAAVLLLGAAPSPGDPAPSTDPLLPFSTLLGGAEGEADPRMALGPDGALWIATVSFSTDFPGAPRPAGAGNLLVLRFDPGTREVLSALWTGTAGSDTPRALAFDGQGNAYVAGSTTSPTFPVTAGIPAPPVQDPPKFDRNAYLVKVLPGGTAIAWSAVIGGTGDEIAEGLAVSPQGDPILVGSTTSEDFPVASPFQAKNRGDYDAFVCRIRADGSGFVHSSYLGGPGRDFGGPVVVLPGGGILFSGTTRSASLPFTGRLLGAPGEFEEGTLVEIDAPGTAVLRADRVGDTRAWGMTGEPGGRVLVWGTTRDPDFPAVAAPHGPPGESGDVFLLRLGAGDMGVLAGALYGGSGRERPVAAAVGPDGTVWVGGDAPRPRDLPVPGGARALYGTYTDAFAAAFDPVDLSLTYATYLGGRESEFGGGMVVAADGSAWFVGGTGSSDFPHSEPLQSRGENEYFGDLFLARLLPGEPETRPAAPSGLAAAVAGDRSVLLTWEDRSFDETGFAVYRRTGESLPGFRQEEQGFVRVAVVPAGTASFVDGGLTSDRAYGWAVQAFNDSGGSAPTAVAVADLGATLSVSITAGAYSFRGRNPDLHLRGTLASEGGLDPRADGFAVEFVDRRHSVPDVLRWSVPAGDPGWRNAGRMRIRWKDDYLRLVIDPATGAFDLHVRAPDRMVGPGEAMPIQFTVGEHSGRAEPVWSAFGRSRVKFP